MPTMATSVVSLNSPMKVLTMPGNDDPQRLRQDDQAHHLPVAEAERHRALVLALGDRLQAAADHLGHIGRSEQRDADQRPQQPVRRVFLRHEQRQHGVGHEQHGDQRHAAHELDEDHREQLDDRQPRAPAQAPAPRRAAARTRCRPPRSAASPCMPPHSPVSTRGSPKTVGEHRHDAEDDDRQQDQHLRPLEALPGRQRLFDREEGRPDPEPGQPRRKGEDEDRAPSAAG